MKDRIFADPCWEKKLKVFQFTQEVSQVFDDMIARSVPFYKDTQKMIANVALQAACDWQQHRQKKDEKNPNLTPVIFDLGCSTGTTLLTLKANWQNDGIVENGRKLPLFTRAKGIDNAPAMLEKARTKLHIFSKQNDINLKTAIPQLDIDFFENDIKDFPMLISPKDEEVVVFFLCYTLQFIPAKEKLALLKKIRQSLCPVGRLILCEKTREDDAKLNNEFQQAHYAFKRKNDYSENEIARKRRSLEKSLCPDTLDQHKKRLLEAGFSAVSIMHKWYNFATLQAIV